MNEYVWVFGSRIDTMKKRNKVNNVNNVMKIRGKERNICKNFLVTIKLSKTFTIRKEKKEKISKF